MIQLNPEAPQTEPEKEDGIRPDQPLIPARFFRPFGEVKGQIFLLLGLSNPENMKFGGFDLQSASHIHQLSLFPHLFFFTSLPILNRCEFSICTFFCVVLSLFEFI